MRGSKWQSIIVVIISVLLIITGLHGYIKIEEKKIEVIYIPKIIDGTNEFWTALIAGAQMAAQEEQIHLQIVAPDSEENYEQQNELIYWAIEQEPDAILISPCDYQKNLEACKKVRESGTKLIFVDSHVEGMKEDCVIETDNFIAGKKIGQFAKEYITQDTQIAIVSHVKNSSTAIERISGFEYELGDMKEQIVTVAYCDSNYDKAYTLTEQIMREYPKVELIIGTNEYSAVGAANAIKDMNLQNQVNMIGFDNSIEQVKLLEEQVLQGIVIQKPFNMGYLAVKQAVAMVKNETYQEKVDSGSVLITEDNMNQQENQKLLFPFVGKQFRETANILE